MQSHHNDNNSTRDKISSHNNREENSMNRAVFKIFSLITMLVFVLTNALVPTQPVLAASFTSGNLVVYRVGDGGAGLTGVATAVFLDEYTPAGALVQSIAMPIAVSGSNKRLTASGSSTTEGMLTRSTDGQYLVLAGYDATPGTASISGTSSSTVNRVVGRVDASGTID